MQRLNRYPSFVSEESTYTDASNCDDKSLASEKNSNINQQIVGNLSAMDGAGALLPTPVTKYSTKELACNLRDAVVFITRQFAFKAKEGELEFGDDACGNGFFIKGHYIMCPASLVLLCPMDLKCRDRVPMCTVSSGDKYPNLTIRASKILVTVSNVNGSGSSHSYEADLVGVDGAANIAILKLNTTCEWNRSNPRLLETHPYLNWGKSRSASPGDSVLLIGNISKTDTIGLTNSLLAETAENGVAVGYLADNRYTSYGGNAPGELLLLSNVLEAGKQKGLPVITTNGKVIGMTLGTDKNIALSEFFMRRPVKALIKTVIDRSVPIDYQGFVDSVADPISDYHRYNKSCLGLAGIAMVQQDYNTIINLTDSGITRGPSALVKDSISNGPPNKEIVGYRILAIAGDTNSDNTPFIPGGSPSVGSFPDLKPSPLLSKIQVGDIITHINGYPLGDRKGQVAPSLVLWRIRPGQLITIKYKKQSEGFKSQYYEVSAVTQSYEPFMDYPWRDFISNTNFMPVLM